MSANDDFSNFWKEERKVPCNGCIACCRENVELKPEHGDDVSKYQIADYINDLGNMAVRLARKENGDCVYLEGHNCTIHAERPLVCRTYDCRVAFLSFTRATRAQHADDPKFDAGELRLPSLEPRARRAAIMIRKWREALNQLQSWPQVQNLRKALLNAEK